MAKYKLENDGDDDDISRAQVIKRQKIDEQMESKQNIVQDQEYESGQEEVYESVGQMEQKQLDKIRKSEVEDDSSDSDSDDDDDDDDQEDAYH